MRTFVEFTGVIVETTILKVSWWLLTRYLLTNRQRNKHRWST